MLDGGAYSVMSASATDQQQLVTSSNEMFRNIFHNTESVTRIDNKHVYIDAYHPQYTTDLRFIKRLYPTLIICHVFNRPMKSKSQSKSKLDSCLLM